MHTHTHTHIHTHTAGIPLVPHVGGSLGMVPESHTMTQREYSWSNNSPHSPSLPNTWNNHPEWSGFVGHENERVRSQSWAGLVSNDTAIFLYRSHFTIK